MWLFNLDLDLILSILMTPPLQSDSSLDASSANLRTMFIPTVPTTGAPTVRQLPLVTHSKITPPIVPCVENEVLCLDQVGTNIGLN